MSFIHTVSIIVGEWWFTSPSGSFLVKVIPFDFGLQKLCYNIKKKKQTNTPQIRTEKIAFELINKRLLREEC